jgi:hypothetical protein
MMVSVLLVVRRLSGNISEYNLSNHILYWSVSEWSWIPPLLLFVFVYDVLYVKICQLFTTVVIASIHFKSGHSEYDSVQTVGLVKGVRILNYWVFVSWCPCLNFKLTLIIWLAKEWVPRTWTICVIHTTQKKVTYRTTTCIDFLIFTRIFDDYCVMKCVFFI